MCRWASREIGGCWRSDPKVMGATLADAGDLVVCWFGGAEIKLEDFYQGCF